MTSTSRLGGGSPNEEVIDAHPERIRVCHIVSGDLWAGAEVNTTTLLRSLAKNPELEMSAILLNEGEMARRLRTYGVDVQVIPESQKKSLEIFDEASRFLRSRSVRILHSHRYKENLLSVLLTRRCSIPHLVCTCHGAPEPFEGWLDVKHRAVAYLDRFVARHFAERVISVSDELRIGLLRDLPACKVVTVRTGIDAEQVRSALTKDEAKRSLGIPEHAKVMGYAGRLVPVKRLDIFLGAAKQIAKRDSSVVFVIVGDGPEEARLKTLARELGLGEQVHFLAFRERVHDVMRAFDLFVLCSDHEGTPRSVLEALYLGVPVVARAVGGIPEILQDGVTGVLIDSAEPSTLADACSALLQDERRLQQMAATGPAQVGRSLCSERSASQLIQVYRSLDKRK
jgi:L-malate glycosyltransferase